MIRPGVPNNGGGDGAGAPTGSPALNRRQQQQQPQQKSLRVSTPPSPPARVRIIPEIYNDYNKIGEKQALNELDAALNENCPVIVIEPMNLGDQTIRWIRVGNCLHKTSVLCGGTAMLGLYLGDPWPRANGLWYTVCGVLGGVSALAYLTHTLSWQRDPCCTYQVETDPFTLAQLLTDANYYTGSQGGGNGIQAASVVVLVKKDDRGRKYLQNSVAIGLVIVTAYRLYKFWA